MRRQNKMGMMENLDLNQMTRSEKETYLFEIQTAKDKKFIDLINSAYEKFNDQRKDNISKQWKEAGLMRRGKRIGTKYKGQSKKSSNEVRNCCNTIASRIRDILVGGKEWFDLLSPSKNLAYIAEIFKKYMLFQFDATSIYQKLFEASDMLVTYGKCFLKITWGMNKKRYKQTYWLAERKEIAPGVFDGLKYKKKTVTIDGSLSDNIDITVPFIEDIYIDATIPNLQDQPILVEEMEVSWGHLKKLSKEMVGSEGLYNIKPEYKKLTALKLGEKKIENVRQYAIQKAGVVLDSLTELISGTYKLRQAYFLFDLNDDGYEERCVATVLVGKSQSVLIQQPMELPYLHGQLPYTDADFETDSLTAYGEGVPAISREKHIDLCDNSSCLSDNSKFITNRMWLMERNAMDGAAKYMVSEQNKIIPVRKFPGIEPLTPTDMTMSHLSIHKFYTEDLRSAVGATGSLQGLPSRYGTTAKESSQLLAQANIRITDILKRAEKTMIEPMLEQCASLIMQFIDDKQIVEIIGEDGCTLESLEFTPQDIIFPCKFMAAGVTQVQNKLMKSQQLLNLLAQQGSLPQGILKVENILKEWMSLWGERNPEKFIKLSEKENLVKPSDENMLMNQGQRVIVNPAEDVMAHLAVHVAGLQVCPEESKPLYIEHIQDTQEAYFKMQQEAAMMEMAAGGGQGGSLQQKPATERGMEMQSERTKGNRPAANSGGVKR
jgi:hypothetical protein